MPEIKTFNISDFLLKFENESFDFCGVNWWPLIKNHLNFVHFYYSKNGYDVSIFPNSTSQYVDVPPFKYRIWIASLRDKFNMRFAIGNTHTLVLTDTNNRTTRWRNNLINQYTDPFLQYFDSIGVKYELYDLASGAQNIIKVESVKYLMKIKICKLFNRDILFHQKIRKLSDSFKESFGSQLELYKLLVDVIIDSQSMYCAFEYIFKYKRFNRVLFYCYYNNSIMAINRAAVKSGLSTIEYQHSQVSSQHRAYSGWTGKESTQFFPTKIWAWDADDATHLQKTFDFVPGFEAIIGGNVYLSLYVDKTNNKKSKETKPRVLLTLQGIGLPEFISDYIKKSEGVIWYVRRHPRQPADADLILELKVANPDCVDIERANRDSIIDLLSISDFHITAYSGTAKEAEYLGVKNIIFSEMGYLSYKEKIISGDYIFIESPSQLDDALKNRDLHVGSSNVKAKLTEDMLIKYFVKSL